MDEQDLGLRAGETVEKDAGGALGHSQHRSIAGVVE
jgi:hypothetical protein